MAQEILPEEPQLATLSENYFFRWLQRFYRHIRKLSRNFESSTPITGDHTVSINDCFLNVDASGGDVTLLLPPISDVTNGKAYYIKKIDSSAFKVIVDGDGTETIDDSLTMDVIFQYDCMKIVCDDTEWWIV